MGKDTGKVEQDAQLVMLMDYTKFHIGMYTTLGTLLIGFLALYKDGDTVERARGFLFATLACLAIAGLCGGIVAANLPHATRFSTFEEQELGPIGLKWFKSSTWMTLEHLAFWAGIVVALSGVWCVTRS